MTGRAINDRLYRERHRDTIVVRDRERRRAKAEACGYAKRLRARDDDDRGLRRLLLDLGLSSPPPTPQRTVERLQWHRAGAARTPVLVAVVQLPSTWQLLEAARRDALRAEPEREPAMRRGSPEAQDSTGGRDCTWRQYEVYADRVTLGFQVVERRGYGAGDKWRSGL